MFLGTIKVDRNRGITLGKYCGKSSGAAKTISSSVSSENEVSANIYIFLNKEKHYL
jgi:hypothetical protein